PLVEVDLLVGRRQAREARRTLEVEVELTIVRSGDRRVLRRTHADGDVRLLGRTGRLRLARGECCRDAEAEPQPRLHELPDRGDGDEVAGHAVGDPAVGCDRIEVADELRLSNGMAGDVAPDMRPDLVLATRAEQVADDLAVLQGDRARCVLPLPLDLSAEVG